MVAARVADTARTTFTWLLSGWFITLQEEAMRTPLPTLTALVFSAGATLALAGPPETVTSPNGKVEINFRLGEKGRPLYDVSFGGRPIVADSALGLTLRARTLLWGGPPVADPLTEGFEGSSSLTLELAHGGGAELHLRPKR